MPKVAAKPKAKLTVRNMPCVPLLNTSWATAPQPNIWRQKDANERCEDVCCEALQRKGELCGTGNSKQELQLHARYVLI